MQSSLPIGKVQSLHLCTNAKGQAKLNENLEVADSTSSETGCHRSEKWGWIYSDTEKRNYKNSRRR